MPATETRNKRAAEPAPAPAPRSAPAAVLASDLEDEVTDIEAEVAYLRSRGWKKVAPHETNNPTKRWLDPLTGQPGKRVLVVPEVRDMAGRVERGAIYQQCVGIPAWHYNRIEAVRIQRDRDEEAARKK